jgi:hypothetical protein
VGQLTLLKPALKVNADEITRELMALEPTSAEKVNLVASPSVLSEQIQVLRQQQVAHVEAALAVTNRAVDKLNLNSNLFASENAEDENQD